MRRAIIMTLVLVGFMGCHCRRCQGQEVQSATGTRSIGVAMTTLNATEVVRWKVSIYKGLNALSRDPASSVCDLFLRYAFGVTDIPTGEKMTEISVENKTRMMRISQTINAALGYAYIRQSAILDDDTINSALDAAIESATTTITDVTQRRALIRRAQALRRE